MAVWVLDSRVPPLWNSLEFQAREEGGIAEWGFSERGRGEVCPRWPLSVRDFLAGALARCWPFQQLPFAVKENQTAAFHLPPGRLPRTRRPSSGEGWFSSYCVFHSPHPLEKILMFRNVHKIPLPSSSICSKPTFIPKGTGGHPLPMCVCLWPPNSDAHGARRLPARSQTSHTYLYTQEMYLVLFSVY